MANKTDLELEGRKAAARSLRSQIDELAEGKAPSTQPSSLRDFIARKMAESKRKKTKQSAR